MDPKMTIGVLEELYSMEIIVGHSSRRRGNKF